NVNDTEAPKVSSISADPVVLWPPNHKMRDVTINYTATDNCGVTSTLSVSSSDPIKGGSDGDQSPDWEIIDGHHVRLRAEKANNGQARYYTIKITISDGCNPPVDTSITVVVAHNITGPETGNPFKVGSTVSFSGVFWDKPGSKHTAKWLLDGNAVANGTVTEPSGNQVGKITGSYKFNSPGVYKLQMNVTDQAGVTSYANTNNDLDAIVVIYDPNGGNTYGGGYFESSVGALRANPSATGKASYGFAMNYFKNSTNPKGETQFEFKVGEFEFNALNFDYLVINKSMAQFKGTGKIIGGQSGLGFTMTVVDGQLDGTGIDKIRMKIYNKNNGSVIYDNQPGQSDAELPIQPVGANSTIVISGNNAPATQINSTQTAAMETGNEKASQQFVVVAFPNPSASSFTLNIKGNSTEKIMMQVVDMHGRTIETRNVNANSSIGFGHRYNAGTYFVRIIQGQVHKEIKLVKLSD
ncbi:MAG TPA: T9SS type A sorting domain-containing protein, partial [Chitinophagaceae bacterium]|nr:T9SS type A sorting domain-containing protein [Chitinophagaceae bacterium]